MSKYYITFSDENDFQKTLLMPCQKKDLEDFWQWDLEDSIYLEYTTDKNGVRINFDFDFDIRSFYTMLDLFALNDILWIFERSNNPELLYAYVEYRNVDGHNLNDLYTYLNNINIKKYTLHKHISDAKQWGEYYAKHYCYEEIDPNAFLYNFIDYKAIGYYHEERGEVYFSNYGTLEIN